MSEQWFLYKEGKQIGPYSRDEVIRQLVSGNLKTNDLIWSKNLSGWTPAGQVPELLSAAYPASTGSANFPPPAAAPPPSGEIRPAPPSSAAYRPSPTPVYGTPGKAEKSNPLLLVLIILIIAIVILGGVLIYNIAFSGSAGPGSSRDFVGSWMITDLNYPDERMYYQLASDGTIVVAVQYDDEGYFIRTRYRIEESNGLYHLNLFDPETQAWIEEDIPVLTLHSSSEGNVTVDGDTMPMTRISDREFDALISTMEEILDFQ